MNEKNQYFKIGIFILVGIIILIVSIIIFGSGRLFKEEIIMETYFDGSVQGLDVGSPVKYRGVKIGEVQDISTLNQEYRLQDEEFDEFYKYGVYVMVTMKLDADAFPYISKTNLEDEINKLVTEKGLRVKFSYLGITGLAYLETDFVDPQKNPPLEIVWKPKNLYIPSVPNAIELVTNSLNEISRSLTEDFIPLLRNLSRASSDFPGLSENLNETLQKVNISADNLPYISAKMSETLDNLHVISRDLREITTTLKQSPSQAIFGGPPPNLGIDKK